MERKEFNLKEYQKITDPVELKKSMFIEASAGTGKTYTITGIIQKLIKEKIDLEKILVVTYTEKAAGELRERIRKACPKQDVDNASIFTIHSFCQKTLSEFSFTANQCANLSLVEDTAIEDFIDLWIRNVLKEDSEFKKLFEDAQKQTTFINQLKRDFKQAVSKYYLNQAGKENEAIVGLDTEYFMFFREQPLTYNQYNQLINFSSIEDLLFIDDFESVWKHLNSNLQAKKAEAFRDDLLNNINVNHILEYNSNSFRTNTVGEEIKDDLIFFRDLKKDFQALKKEVDVIPRISFLSTQLQKIYLAWQQQKEKNKMQSYDDMLRSVREAVCSKNSKLKDQLQKKYTYAIIDEFQDTNQKQWDIFKTVFMEDADHTIIVVGDPKQSIYAFQGADVNVYANAIKSIEENGGAAYSLQTNYRSTDSMVRACNLLFKNFFDPDSKSIFTESKPSGTKLTAKYCDKEIKPVWIAGSPDNNTNEKDFARIAVQTIIDCCSWENGKTKLQVNDNQKLRNVNFRDFAILGRTSTELKETERALRKAGIPFLRYKDGNLFYGKECLQWISLINAITAKDFTSTNRRILNEALFSDFFNISIDEVDNEKYDNPSCDERQLIIKWQQLAQQRKWAKLFEKIFADTDIENRLSRLDKMQMLSKIRQIGNYALDYLYKNDCSLEDVSKHLLRLSTDSDSSMDEGDIVEKGTDFECVQLMTIHASKGLEFPVVIVPAGLRQRNNNVPQVYLYHDDNNNAKLSFAPYGKTLSIKEDDFERERIFYVAYTRASSLLVLPYYDVWNPATDKTKAEMYEFLSRSISSLFEEKGKQFINEISDIGKKYEELQADVQKLLAESKKNKEQQTAIQTEKDVSTEASQLDTTKALSSKVPSLSIHKHSYSSLSHKKAVAEEMTENGGRADKEGSEEQQLSLAGFDMAQNPVSYIAVPGTNVVCPPAITAPYNFPKGTKLGIALHEVFEKADFSSAQDDEGLRRLITACFEKQTLSIPEGDPDQWLTYTASILWNTVNAALPEISGTTPTGNYFKLSDLAAADRISEAEFNMNTDLTGALKNYCNGFIDLVFKRNVGGRDLYSILDWKSDTFDAGEYYDGTLLKTHTDDRYSIQRVLYSYSLIKWLATFYPDETEAQVFENHFGGIYYAYVRGCHADTCSGIYARTWNSWQELEAAFKKIMGAEHESR